MGKQGKGRDLRFWQEERGGVLAGVRGKQMWTKICTVFPPAHDGGKKEEDMTSLITAQVLQRH